MARSNTLSYCQHSASGVHNSQHRAKSTGYQDEALEVRKLSSLPIRMGGIGGDDLSY